MATATKRTRLGNYIDKVDDFDIRMLFNTSKDSQTGKLKTVSHDVRVCKGRKLIKNGFKTKEQAIEFIKTNK